MSNSEHAQKVGFAALSTCWVRGTSAGIGAQINCFKSSWFAAISREKWERRTFPHWLRNAEMTAQTCPGEISLKVI